MERWIGTLQVPTRYGAACRVAASLCYSLSTSSLCIPSKNAIMFMGDRVHGTGNSVIERLSNLETVASILVSKLGGYGVNAWVVEAPLFLGPFAVYKEFLSSLSKTGEPFSYDPQGLPASNTTTSLVTNFLSQVKEIVPFADHSSKCTSSNIAYREDAQTKYPDSILLGFSKGGVVLNQLLTELASLDGSSENERKKGIDDIEFIDKTENIIGYKQSMSSKSSESNQIINSLVPIEACSFLRSIQEVHYVDVGLNTPGAYQTDPSVIEGLHRIAMSQKSGLRIILHGTPRQWFDFNRPWIATEKNTLLELLEKETESSKVCKLEAYERLYFADEPSNIEMHFRIIDSMDLS